MLFRSTDFFRAYEEKGDGRKDEWEGLITLPGLRQMLKEDGEVFDDNEPIGYFFNGKFILYDVDRFR